jgi:mannose-6-phosphate isomerase-like protein (cupin superfamily)
MPGFDNTKHGKYIVELKPGHSIYNKNGPPQIGAFGREDLNGANFSLGYSYLTKPFLMVGDSHKHDFDQVIFFLGGSADNITDFDAEIEFTLEDKLNSITYPACVYIPKGTMHGPLNFKRITKPLMFFDITLASGPSIRPLPPPTQVRP